MNNKKSKASTILMNGLSNCRNKLWGISVRGSIAFWGRNELERLSTTGKIV